MSLKEDIDRFINRLEELCPPPREGEPPQLTSEQRAALATLRRGLGRKPGEAADIFRYIGYDLPGRLSQRALEHYFLAASLFALHPKSAKEGNIGNHLATLRSENEEKTKALERRLTLLLNAHIDDLPYHLRSIVTWLKSNDVAINWRRLLYDLRHWDNSEAFVQTQWAMAFWGRQPEETADQAAEAIDTTAV